jgi:hypothetical protein
LIFLLARPRTRTHDRIVTRARVDASASSIVARDHAAPLSARASFASFGCSSVELSAWNRVRLSAPAEHPEHSQDKHRALHGSTSPAQGRRAHDLPKAARLRGSTRGVLRRIKCSESRMTFTVHGSSESARTNHVAQKDRWPALISQAPASRLLLWKALEKYSHARDSLSMPVASLASWEPWSAQAVSSSRDKGQSGRSPRVVTTSRSFRRITRLARLPAGARSPIAGDSLDGVVGDAAHVRQPRRTPEANAVRIPFRALAVFRRPTPDRQPQHLVFTRLGGGEYRFVSLLTRQAFLQSQPRNLLRCRE